MKKTNLKILTRRENRKKTYGVFINGLQLKPLGWAKAGPPRDVPLRRSAQHSVHPQSRKASLAHCVLNLDELSGRPSGHHSPVSILGLIKMIDMNQGLKPNETSKGQGLREGVKVGTLAPGPAWPVEMRLALTHSAWLS